MFPFPIKRNPKARLYLVTSVRQHQPRAVTHQQQQKRNTRTTFRLRKSLRTFFARSYLDAKCDLRSHRVRVLFYGCLFLGCAIFGRPEVRDRLSEMRSIFFLFHCDEYLHLDSSKTLSMFSMVSGSSQSITLGICLPLFLF